jgi:hypothetical protein
MQYVIQKGVYSKLTSTASLTNALGGAKIYYAMAPVGTQLPYVIIQVAGGGHTNRTPRDEFDVVVNVTVRAASAQAAGAIADIIRDTLHQAELTLDAPWTAYNCQETDMIPTFLTEEDGRQYWTAGGAYRIRAVT